MFIKSTHSVFSVCVRVYVHTCAYVCAYVYVCTCVCCYFLPNEMSQNHGRSAL